MAEMKRKNKLPYAGGTVTLAMAILCMAAGLPITARAAVNEQNKGNNSGKTTVRLGVATEAPKNVSFEVPLYYTAAIVANDKGETTRANKVVYPTGYHITNTSLDQKKLVVAKVEVSSVPGATWDLVEALDGTETAKTKKMAVSIGSLQLPAVTKESTTPVAANMKAQTSVFYKKNDQATGGTYQVLGDRDGSGRMDLDVVFTIPPLYAPQGDSATIAQFKVVYSLTTLDENGKPLGLYDQNWVNQDYLGPAKTNAETTNKTGAETTTP